MARRACTRAPRAASRARRRGDEPSSDESPNGQPPRSTCALELLAELRRRSSRPASPRSRRAGTGTCRGSRSQTSSEQVEVALRSRRPPRACAGSAASSASPRGTACTCRTTRACRTRRRGAPSCTMQQRSSSTTIAGRAQRRAQRAERVVVVADVDLVGRQDHRRRAARDDRLQLAAVGDAAAEVVDQLAQRRAELDLVVAGRHDVARRSRRRACRASSATPSFAYSAPPIAMIGGTVAIVSTLLTTVGAAYRPCDRRERRLRARLAALALERVEQRRLLAADVGAGAAVDDDRRRRRGAPAGPRSSSSARDEDLVRARGTRRGCR